MNKDSQGDLSLKISSEELERGFLTYKVELIKLFELSQEVKTIKNVFSIKHNLNSNTT